MVPICCLFSCSQLEDMQWTTLKGTEEFYTYMKVTEVRVYFVNLDLMKKCIYICKSKQLKRQGLVYVEVYGRDGVFINKPL